MSKQVNLTDVLEAMSVCKQNGINMIEFKRPYQERVGAGIEDEEVLKAWQMLQKKGLGLIEGDSAYVF